MHAVLAYCVDPLRHEVLLVALVLEVELRHLVHDGVHLLHHEDGLRANERASMAGRASMALVGSGPGGAGARGEGAARTSSLLSKVSTMALCNVPREREMVAERRKEGSFPCPTSHRILPAYLPFGHASRGRLLPGRFLMAQFSGVYSSLPPHPNARHSHLAHSQLFAAALTRAETLARGTTQSQAAGPWERDRGRRAA